MSVEELNTLRAEAAAVVEEPGEAPQEAEVPATVDPALSGALSHLVYNVAKPVCRKAHVTPVEMGEAELIGGALAQLVAVYDVGPKDPKGAAWLGMGMAMMAVVGNRERLPGEAPGAIAAPPVADAIPGPPVFGDAQATYEPPKDAQPFGTTEILNGGIQ